MSQALDLLKFTKNSQIDMVDSFELSFFSVHFYIVLTFHFDELLFMADIQGTFNHLLVLAIRWTINA